MRGPNVRRLSENESRPMLFSIMARIPTDTIGRTPARLPGTPGRAASPSAPSGRSSRRSGSDPFDLESAIDRLRTLLAFDAAHGPRDGIPRRGFYLNVLV